MPTKSTELRKVPFKITNLDGSVMWITEDVLVETVMFDSDITLRDGDTLAIDKEGNPHITPSE